MQWLRIAVEKSKKRYILFIIGTLVIGLLMLLNIILKVSIRTRQEKLIFSQRQLSVLQKKSLSNTFTKIIKLNSKCPSEQSGNPDANLTIKYFYSPVCFWCILEDQHFGELLQTEGQAFKLEKYNRENCETVMQKYKLSLTPGFVFSTKNESQEYTVDGYISLENLTKVICDVTGYCAGNPKKSPTNEPIRGQRVIINYK